VLLTSPSSTRGFNPVEELERQEFIRGMLVSRHQNEGLNEIAQQLLTQPSNKKRCRGNQVRYYSANDGIRFCGEWLFHHDHHLRKQRFPARLRGDMSDLFFARSQMGMSLAFHIIFAVIGMAMPLLMAVSEGCYLWTKRPIYLELSKRWAAGTPRPFAFSYGS